MSHPWNKGRKVSKDDYPNYGNRGKTFSEETKKLWSKNRKGKKHWWTVRNFGSKAGPWKGGIYPVGLTIRNLKEYDEWKYAVCAKSKKRCVLCGARGRDADHIRRFSYILEDFLKEYSQFSPIEDKDVLVRLAINYKPFWDVSNGRYLCRTCHKGVTWPKFNLQYEFSWQKSK